MMKKTDIKCTDVFSHICDKLDQDLDSPKCRRIKKHLEECPNCSAYLVSMKRTISLYRAYPTTKAPAGAAKKIMAKLQI